MCPGMSSSVLFPHPSVRLQCQPVTSTTGHPELLPPSRARVFLPGETFDLFRPLSKRGSRRSPCVTTSVELKSWKPEVLTFLWFNKFDTHTSLKNVVDVLDWVVGTERRRLDERSQGRESQGTGYGTCREDTPSSVSLVWTKHQSSQ